MRQWVMEKNLVCIGVQIDSLHFGLLQLRAEISVKNE